MLREHGVSVRKVVQHPGEVVVLFPYAYHMSFDHGLVVSESANFATPRWVEYGKRHRPCGCDCRAGGVARAPFSMAPIVTKFQPSLAKKWLAEEDFGRHPENDGDDDVADLDEDLLQQLEINREAATEGFFTFSLSGGRQLQYDYKEDVLHSPFALKEDEEKEFERWKRGFRKEFDIYQHCSDEGLRFKVDAKTGKFATALAEHLKKSLDMSRLEGMRELVARGLFKKIGREVRRVPRVYLKEGEEKAETRKVVSEVPGQLYRHVMREEIVAVVNPTTKKLLVEADEDLKELLKVMPMPDLIESGVMRLAAERKVRVTKHIVDGPEEVDKTNTVDVDVYQSAGGGGTPQKRFYVACRSGEVLGDLPQDVQQKVDSGLTLADCVGEGSLTLVGSEVIRPTSEPEPPEAGETLEEIFWHRSERLEVHLHPKERRCVVMEASGRDAQQFMTLEWAVLEGLVRSQELLKIGEVFRPPQEVTRKSDEEEVSTQALRVRDRQTGAEVFLCHARGDWNNSRQVFKVVGDVVDERCRDLAHLVEVVASLRESPGVIADLNRGVSGEMAALVRVPLRFERHEEFDFVGCKERRVVRSDPDKNYVAREDLDSLGVLRDVALDQLVAKGLLRNRRKVKMLSNASRELFISLVGPATFDVSCHGDVVAAVCPQERTAYLIRLPATFDDDDVARVARLEARCVREEKAVVVRTETELMAAEEEAAAAGRDDGYDSDCSSDPGGEC